MASLLSDIVSPAPAASAGQGRVASGSRKESGEFAAALSALGLETLATPDTALAGPAATPVRSAEAAVVEPVPVDGGLSATGEEDGGEAAEFIAEAEPVASIDAVMQPAAAVVAAPLPEIDTAGRPVQDMASDAAMPADPARSKLPSQSSPEALPLQQGHASATAAPPSSAADDGGMTPAPDATAVQGTGEGATRTAVPTATTTAMLKSAMPTAAQSVPAAAQEIAALPHVIAVQASAAPEASATDQADTVTPPSQPAVSAEGPGRAAPSAAPADPDLPAVEPVLKAGVQTEGDAAEAALDVLTKDRSDTKAQTVQPTTPTAAKAGAEAEAPEPAPVSPAKAAPVADKPETPKPDSAPPEKKPVAAGQSQTPEPRAANMPISDRAVVQDAGVKTQAQQASLPPVVIPHIAGEIASRVKQGSSRFEIRLDPPELGRIDVRIDIDSDGRVTSRLSVEKSETLDLLKADQRALERALNEAGFKADQNALSFQLKDERGGGQPKFEDMRHLREEMAQERTEEEPVRLAAGTAYRAEARGPGGFDLRV